MANEQALSLRIQLFCIKGPHLSPKARGTVLFRITVWLRHA